MKLAWLIRVFSTLFFIPTTLAISMSLPGCQEKCGNVTIPYPFGIGPKCSANSSFTVICPNSTNPPKPFLSNIQLEVRHFSVCGTVVVNLPLSPLNCSNGTSTTYVPIQLEGSPFTVSAYYNSLVVMGCQIAVWLRTNETRVRGCMADCDGFNYCHITIPERLQELQYTYESIQANNSNIFCGYVFPVDKTWLQNKDFLSDPSTYPFDQELGLAPVVLEWELGARTNFSNTTCNYPRDHVQLQYVTTYFRPYDYCSGYTSVKYPEIFCPMHPDDYRCQYYDDYSNYSPKDYVSSSKYCFCRPGFEGNPYILESCRDIDECSDTALNYCNQSETCFNEIGNHHCSNKYVDRPLKRDFNERFRAIITRPYVLVAIVLLGLLISYRSTRKLGKAITKLIKVTKASRKYMFYKRNGGLLLEQQLAAIANGNEKTRLFSSTELAKATDDDNENRILGRGGEGIVYKGMLEDGRIVAVKKFEIVNQVDVEAFINEIVIVSQINHRNVVKLLGCCLESEVPRLVYEFIPNGTLFHHIHEPSEDFPLFWEMRVRIAKEVAGALAYLHSAASVPIYHRDIKSTNILLDENYRAKISDFGTSRSVLIDQTHVTTRVVGTFGYLDPEYFQSSKFTEKSDVYSYGVVLVELLTGEKAISAARVEEGIGLAMHFLHSMEENQLFDIIDARIVKEGKREHIEAMAEIARKCLHLNGKGRPTMKEVGRDLDGIQVEKEESEENGGCSSSVEEDDPDDWSSISDIVVDMPSHSPVLDEP